MLRAKYLRKEADSYDFKGRKADSRLWRGVVKASHILKTETRNMVINGKNTKFWTDKWLMNDCLKNYTMNVIDETALSKQVAEYWDRSHGWKEKLKQFLNPSILDCLDAQSIYDGVNACDEVYWGEEVSGNFTTKSAYHIAIQEVGRNENNSWDKIWKIKVPNRLLGFLWTVKHGRVLCNAKRLRRGMTDRGDCPWCVGTTEDLNHLFRKCPKA